MAEARRTLLVKEIDHRARNALAVVQSIVRLTKASSMTQYIGTVEGRIRALANAHNLLSESRWEGADLLRLVEEELAPYRNGQSERIVISGPAVTLKPETAQTIALVLHELATNAAKYGALSEASGIVKLVWHYDRGDLTLRWEESDGPPVEAPTTKGFGAKVITMSVTQQLGGVADFAWLPTGLRFTMTAPIGNAGLQPQYSSERPTAGSNAQRHALNNGMPLGKRLLLIEDEALVGLMMKDTLIGLGFQVVGPFCKLVDAIEALNKETFEAAVLDINLRGEMTYSLADEIAARGIPFVFVTGYASEAIDARFANVPVLQKPIDRNAFQRIFLAAEESSIH